MTAPLLAYFARHKILSSALAGLVIILIGARLYLPYYLRDYINDEIRKLENYDGQVERVSVSLWRGAYQIHGMNIRKVSGGLDEPFVAARTIDLALDWGSLVRGRIVAEIDIYEIAFNVAQNQTGEGAGWLGFINVISPLSVNRLTVHGGRIAYLDYTADPNIDLFIEDIVLSMTNIRNVREEGSKLPSRLDAFGTSVGGGDVRLAGNLNIIKEVPDFDIALELQDADLTAFNDYAREFAAIDFSKGRVGIYMELAAADGHVVGYVKPVATDLALVDLDQDKNPFNIIWEALVSVFMELFQNQEKDQFALRVPLEGNLNDPEQDGWAAFWSIFKNAFGQAFTKQEDGTIEFNDAYLEALEERQEKRLKREGKDPDETEPLPETSST
ncbi:DUF748 domain-containing protein [Kordiimonas gwangyangensis]|uniref:DUF748 domain-containing protein n=1 Tax=Kordiimonas gwangyangensis TaxID=288022 RepID=UPI000363D553|nr:DUF748 domain-containing protein [Kordiimonas gwangyangensis]